MMKRNILFESSSSKRIIKIKMIKDFLQRIGWKNIVIFISILLFSAISTLVVLQKIDGDKRMVGGANMAPSNTSSETNQSQSGESVNKTEGSTKPSATNPSFNSGSSDTTANPSQSSSNTNSNTTNNPTNSPTANNTASPNPTSTSTPQPTNTPTQNDNVQVSFGIYWENNKPVYDYYVTVCLGDLDVVWGHFFIIDPEGNSWNTGNHDFRQKPCQKIGVVSGSLLNKPLGEYTFKAVVDELGITKTAKATLYPLR